MFYPSYQFKCCVLDFVIMNLLFWITGKLMRCLTQMRRSIMQSFPNTKPIVDSPAIIGTKPIMFSYFDFIMVTHVPGLFTYCLDCVVRHDITQYPILFRPAHLLTRLATLYRLTSPKQSLLLAKINQSLICTFVEVRARPTTVLVFLDSFESKSIAEDDALM